jgi:hypothetical protein
MLATIEAASLAGPEADDRILAHDGDWQFPAITERHAYERMRSSAHLIPPGCAYLGFPWATLIDLLDNKPAEAAALQSRLAVLAERLAGKSRVVTVCQHIRLLRHQQLFDELSVTEIFWSHAVKGLASLPDRPSVRLHPFPLYPVHVPDVRGESCDRNVLFSFVGARARDFYLTETRNHILDSLAADPRGYVRGRSDWHYNKIVYDHQIMGRALNAEGLVDADASDEFKDILARSVFSLCPSGSGPNSIRLWESIGAGAIPVILADTYAPPGDPVLWREAVVLCDESPAAVAALPERLAAMAGDEALLARKRHALRQLWRLYGPDGFTYDIDKLFVAAASAGAGADASTGPAGLSASLPLGREGLLALASETQAAKAGDRTSSDLLLTACTSRMLLDTPGFASLWRDTPALEEACVRLAAQCPEAPASRAFTAARQRFGASSRRAEATVSADPVRVHRLGSNASRMPISYEDYAPLFQGRVEETTLPEDADVVLTAASPNLLECSEEILGLRNAHVSQRLVVLSEEPLWDTTWANDWGRRAGRLEASGAAIDYAILSHATSDIFTFETIPYYVTTRDDFFVRYASLFRRNAAMSAEDVLRSWERAPIRAAFFAEQRHGARYDFRDPEQDLEGLCAYRTRLAEAVRGDGVLRVGMGWSEGAPRRQELPDWHLDKLVLLDRRAFVVSGLENTHYRDYITEKLFDAFAVLGLPLFYASPRHRIHEIIPDTAYLNLYGKTSDEAAGAIEAFEPDLAFATGYLDAQRRLADLFGDPRTLARERARVVRAVARALDAVRAGPQGAPA